MAERVEAHVLPPTGKQVTGGCFLGTRGGGKEMKSSTNGVLELPRAILSRECPDGRTRGRNTREKKC